MWVDEQQAERILRTTWCTGADRVWGLIIEQCDDLLAANIVRDPLAVKIIRDWCEIARLETAFLN